MWSEIMAKKYVFPLHYYNQNELFPSPNKWLNHVVNLLWYICKLSGWMFLIFWTLIQEMFK